MNQPSSATARALAVTALVVGFIVLIVLVASSLSGGGGGSNGSRGRSPAGRGSSHHGPASYVVKGGDTLTSIAHRTGVPIVRIQRLNPGVDPQVLVEGQRLKLR